MTYAENMAHAGILVTKMYYKDQDKRDIAENNGPTNTFGTSDQDMS